MNRLTVAALFLLTSACTPKAVPVTVAPRSASFLDSEYAPYERPGTSTITGQSFLKTRGGDVKFGAGDEVVLTPTTTYSAEWWTKAVIGGRTLARGTPRAERYTRQTVADGEGRFRFDSLPAGDYYVLSSVVWEVPDFRSAGLEQSGGLVGLQVKVKPAQTVQAILQPLRRYVPKVVTQKPGVKKPKRPQVPGQTQTSP